MKIEPNEPILVTLQREPLAFLIAAAGSNELLTIPLPAESARQLALALLAIPDVAGNFEQLAEAEIMGRIQVRQLSAVN